MQRRFPYTFALLSFTSASLGTGCFGLVSGDQDAPSVDLDTDTTAPDGARDGSDLFTPPAMGGALGDDGNVSSGGTSVLTPSGGSLGTGGTSSGGSLGTGGSSGTGGTSSGGAGGSGGSGGSLGTGGTTSTPPRACSKGQWLAVSNAYNGAAPNAAAGAPYLSGNAAWVLFASSASNLVPGDSNGTGDVFLHSVTANSTQRVSLAFDGAEANAAVSGYGLSADGRYVLLGSTATNLHPDDTDNLFDAYVRDMLTGELELLSVSSSGTKANLAVYPRAISSSGRFVTVVSQASNLVAADSTDYDVFVYDRTLKTMELVSIGTSATNATYTSSHASISADGRYVAFHSGDALTSDDQNGVFDVYRRDRNASLTERFTSGIGNTKLNDHAFVQAMSDDGRYMAGYAIASNLVPGDTNGVRDAFLHDAQTRKTTRFSLTTAGKQLTTDTFQATVSPDGKYASFVANDGNAYLYSIASGKIFAATLDPQGDSPQQLLGGPSFASDSTCMAVTLTPGEQWQADYPDVGQVFLYGL